MSTKNARLVQMGDVIVTDTEAAAVVRSVSVIFHLANGVDAVYPVSDDIEIVDNPDPLPPELGG